MPGRAEWYDYRDPPETIEVVTQDREWTGLLDEHGRKLMRGNIPFGFQPPVYPPHQPKPRKGKR